MYLLTSLGTCAESVQFYCPSGTYPVIPYCTIFFSFLAYRERAERQVDEHNIIKKDPPENVAEIILQDEAINDVMENDNYSILSKGKPWHL